MDIVELRELCLSFPHTTEEFPFDETTLVFKVFNKMFCCTDIIRMDCREMWPGLGHRITGKIPGDHFCLPLQQEILERDKYARHPVRQVH